MNLVAANGSRIRSYGTRRMELRINQDKYNWLFQVADVHKPIIGADFLRAHNLLVDLKNKRLLRADNLTVIKGVIKEVPVGLCNIMSLAEENEFATLLKNRPELTTPTFTLKAPKHVVKHYQRPSGPLSSPKAITGETTGSKRRIQDTGWIGHSPKVKQSILIPTPFGAEARGEVASMCRFQKAELLHRRWQISDSMDTWLHRAPLGEKRLQQNRFGKRLPPGPCQPWRHPQNSGNHTYRTFWVPPDAVWPKKRC